MKNIFRTSGIIAVAGLALAACGSAAPHKATSAINPPPHGAGKTVSAKYGWHTVNGKLELVLPHVGKATPTILAFSQQDYPFYTHIVNPADWIKSKTFGQWIFVGPYTSGVNYQRVRDAKLGAITAMERDILFANGATTWPSKIGTINTTVYGQPTIGDMQGVVAVEQYVAKHSPGKTFTTDVPSVATIAESPVGMLTPKMMSNTPSQEQYSVPGTCVPHTFAVYFAGTKNLAVTGTGDSPSAVFEAQYGPTDNLASTNPNVNGEGYNNTTSCKSMP
jgi:hypothetical protein